MEVIFKGLTTEDIPSTVNLINRCFDEENDIEEARGLFLNTMHDANNIYVNGVLNGEVIAHAKLTIVKTIYKPMGTYGVINHVCVAEYYRRHHIATHLLNVLFKVAKDNGCKNIVLWSNNERIAAHAFYKKYGFTKEESGFFSKDIL